MNKIIDRYIFKEIASSFIIIIFVLTFVLLMGKMLQIMDLFVNKGVSFSSIVKIIIYLMPYFLLFTIPITLLISTLIAMGRLSSDNEITAFKTSGISLLQLYYPVAIASFIAFIFTIIMSYFIVPKTNFETRRLLFNIVQENANVGIKEKIFNDDFRDFLIYADKIPVHKKYMEGVVVSDKRVLGEQNTIFAKKAFLVSDPESMIVKLKMEDGSIHTVSSNLKNYRKIDFKSYDINLDLSAALAHFDKSAKDMTMNELLEKAKKIGLRQKDIRELYIEVHKKFAIPVACILFGLLGLPLGIKSHRAVKSRGFSVGLLIVCFYYILRMGGEAFAETGYIPVTVGVWTPNILFALIGICLFYITYKEIPVFQKLNAIFKKGQTKKQKNMRGI
ncbi:MAG: LPS export ABC transporter permease LptF [Syntrophaceae bacterium]|nr:LPS export ABC transporter permease LptF [Syntrophaceae bacterium]